MSFKKEEKERRKKTQPSMWQRVPTLHNPFICFLRFPFCSLRVYLHSLFLFFFAFVCLFGF